MDFKSIKSDLTDRLPSLLRDEDRYVYDIVKTIEEMSGGQLEISQNTVYTATYKLVSEGKISEYTETVGKNARAFIITSNPTALSILRSSPSPTADTPTA